MRHNFIEQNRTRNKILSAIQTAPNILINYVRHKLNRIDPFILLFKFTARAKYLGDLSMVLACAGIPLALIALIVFDVYGVNRPDFPRLEQMARNIIIRDQVSTADLVVLSWVPPFFIMSIAQYFIFICNIIVINKFTGSGIARTLLFGDIHGLIKDHPDLVKNNGTLSVPKLLWQQPRDYPLQYLAGLALRPKMLSLFVPQAEHANLFSAMDCINLPAEINYNILSFLHPNDITAKFPLKSFEGFRFQDSPHNYSQNQAIDEFIELKFKKAPEHNLLTVLYSLHLRTKNRAALDIEAGHGLATFKSLALKNA